MIFKIKYNFVTLELIGQQYFDLKWNNSKNVWNKCLINCFGIDSLSSNLRDKTTQLSMQHCFHVVIYIIGTQYLHIMHPGKDKSNGYISNHNKMRHPCPKFKVSFYLYFCCFWINVTQINFENIKRKIQRIISDNFFQLKSWFSVDARAPSIPLLNFPFKAIIFQVEHQSQKVLGEGRGGGGLGGPPQHISLHELNHSPFSCAASWLYFLVCKNFDIQFDKSLDLLWPVVNLKSETFFLWTKQMACFFGCISVSSFFLRFLMSCVQTEWWSRWRSPIG